MRILKYSVALLLCVACLLSIVACGEPETQISHTHTIAQRDVPAPNCYSYGYSETYCEYCSYSVKKSDHVLGQHSYKEYYETDVVSTQLTSGKESRHCIWYDHCGMFTDQRDTVTKPPEDFPPAPL